METLQTAGAPPGAPRKSLFEQRQARRDMVSRLALVALVAVSVLGLGGCEAIEAIFKVGAWFGALIVVVLVALVGGLAMLVLKKK